MTYKYYLFSNPKRNIDLAGELLCEVPEEIIKRFPDSDNIIVNSPIPELKVHWNFKVYDYEIARYDIDPDPRFRPVEDFMPEDERAEWEQLLKELKPNSSF